VNCNAVLLIHSSTELRDHEAGINGLPGMAVLEGDVRC
jgi:hypothetical protein